jgi:hypothetical protein
VHVHFQASYVGPLGVAVRIPTAERTSYIRHVSHAPNTWYAPARIKISVISPSVLCVQLGTACRFIAVQILSGTSWLRYHGIEIETTGDEQPLGMEGFPPSIALFVVCGLSLLSVAFCSNMSVCRSPKRAHEFSDAAFFLSQLVWVTTYSLVHF